jgi:hypothetical protein
VKHIDQHILELYVLGDERDPLKREEVARHLEECEGCRSLVGKIRMFYGDADGFHQHHPAGTEVPERALLRRSADLSPLFASGSFAPARRPAGMQRAWQYVQSHRMISAAGGVAFLGALALMAVLLAGPLKKDRAIESFKYNPLENTLEALNANSDVVWKKASDNIALTVQGEQTYGHHYTVLADLDGTGENEVVTTIPMWNSSAATYGARLRVFERDGKARFEKDFDRAVHYKGRSYSSRFTGDGIVVVPDRQGKTSDIAVAVCNNRSPFYVCRYSARGDVLGEYWHFGFLPRISTAVLSGEQRPFLVIAGVNDREDSISGSYPAIVVLDPAKVEGASESSLTAGFGYPTSSAEVFYIRLPRTDIANALGDTEGVIKRVAGDSTALRFYVCVRDQAGLEYIFGADMAVREVKPYDGFERFHARMREEGRIHSRYGPEYFAELKGGVRYWDGTAWRKEVTRVQHR